MKREAMTHLLPTDKKPYSIEKWGKWFFDTADGKYSDRNPKPVGQHLYLTTDEEVKEGDYCIHANELIIAKTVTKASIAYANEYGIIQFTDPRNCKKIIASTDPKLTEK